MVLLSLSGISVRRIQGRSRTGHVLIVFFSNFFTDIQADITVLSTLKVKALFSIIVTVLSRFLCVHL
jgi:hypothetical protein